MSFTHLLALLSIAHGPMTMSAAPALQGGVITSTFDANDEGWTVVGDAQGGSVVPDYQPTGGNPDGHVSADDDVAGGVWYWNAPGGYLGNRAGSYSRVLSFELRQSAASAQFDAVDVVLLGAGMQLNFDTAENPGTEWTPYAVPLSVGPGWTVEGTGAAPTEMEFQTVLADLTALRIRGEYRTGADTGSLDNVVMETEPTTGLESGAPGDGATLSAAMPNPVRTVTRLTLTLAGPMAIRTRIYDVLGREVLRLQDAPLVHTGPHDLRVDATDLPAGLYVVVVEGEGWTASRRFTRVR